MTTADCKVTFRGEIAPDRNEADVRAALGERLRLPPERIEALFTGKPVVIKRDIDAATAEKIRRTFAEAGAICEVSGGTAAESEPAATTRVASAGAAQPAAAKQGDPPAHGGTPDAGASDEVAQQRGPQEPAQPQAGDDPNQTIVHLPVPDDLGDLELAAESAYAGAHDATPAPEIDTSDLAVIADDGPLEPPDETTTAPAIDISDLELEPAPDEPARG